MTKATLTFDAWMRKVNLFIVAKIGLGYEDLPDYCYRDAYDDGVGAFTCARAAIRAAKDY
jgi:hypothetical protein